MTDRVHVEAIFSSRAEAEAAIARLRELGVGDDRIGLVVRLDDGVHVEGMVETDRDVLRAVERGIAAGVPAGVLAGIALAAVGVPGLGALGIGGLLGTGAIGGILAGTYLGALLGIAHEEGVGEELEPGHVLVLVHADSVDDAVLQALREAGATFVGAHDA